MVTGPEVGRVGLLKAYENAWIMHHPTKGTMTSTARLFFPGNVRRSSSVISEMGNSFMEDLTDLLVLDTQDIADPAWLTS